MLTYLQLFGFILVASSSDFDFDFPQQHGMAVVKHIKSRTDNQLLTRMPERIDIQVDLLMDEDEPIILHLVKNDEDLEVKPIYVMGEDSYGDLKVFKDEVAIEQNVGLYQCENSLASFTVKCEGLEYGLCRPHILGSINFNGTDFDIKPNNAPEASMFKKDELYDVYPRKQQKAHGKDCLAGEDQEVAAAPNSLQGDVSRQSDFEHFAMRSNYRMAHSAGYTSYDKRQPIADNYGVESTGSSGTYTVGLLIAVDDIIYQRFYSRSRGYTHAQKEANTKASIRQYYAHTVNAMDLRYRNIKHPVYEIRIVVTGYLIDDNIMLDVWNGPRQSSVEDAMFRAIEWRKRLLSQLPPHDHLMVFTGRDLYSKFTRDYSVTGFASLDSICRQDSVSIIEDKGGFDCIITATHELGHSLGSRHDGDRNICTPHDKFVMTSIGGDVNVHTRLNPFKFSECSKNYFLDRLQTLSNQGYNCLSVRKSYYDPREFAGYTSVATGQLFDPNKQCKMKLGDDSYYGWGGNLGSFKDVCTHMACKSNKTSTSYNLYNAARGTSCGNKMWCIDGECVYDHEAPAKDDSCVHRDSRRSFAAYNSCAHLVASDPSKCMDSYYRQFCCESCKHYTANTIIISGINQNRLGSNMMSIPVGQHVRHIIPNKFSAEGLHAGVHASPRYAYQTRTNKMHPIFSGSQVDTVRNQISKDNKYRVFQASNSNRLINTFHNEFHSPQNSQQQNGHQSQPHFQTSAAQSVFLPDHRRLNSVSPASSSINTVDLTSFRSLIVRTLQLLARTTSPQYTSQQNNHDSLNQVNHNNYISPLRLYHMRNIHRELFDNFGSGSHSSVPKSSVNASEAIVSKEANSTVSTKMETLIKSNSLLSHYKESKPTAKPDAIIDVFIKVKQHIVPPNNSSDSESKKMNSNFVSRAPQTESTVKTNLVLQSQSDGTYPKTTSTHKLLKLTTGPVNFNSHVTRTLSTMKNTFTTNQDVPLRTTSLPRPSIAAKVFKTTDNNIKMDALKAKNISKEKSSGLFDSSVGNIIDPFL